MVVATSALAVLASQFLDRQGADAVALLYVLPIGLAALTFGVWGGIATAGGAFVAFGLFALLSTPDHVGAGGWVTRAVAMFLLGGLLGRAADQTGRANKLALAHQSRRLIVEDENRRYGEGIELSDSILQHLAAAKWAIEEGDYTEASGLLTQALSSGQQMVGELLDYSRRGNCPSGN